MTIIIFIVVIIGLLALTFSIYAISIILIGFPRQLSFVPGVWAKKTLRRFYVCQ